MPPLGPALASADHGSLSERLAAVPLVLWMVWAGVAAITVALMILMRTRWGQKRVVRKCVLLSIFAHVLLGAYAWTVKIVGAPGPRGEDGSLLVTQVKVDEPEKDEAPAAKPWHATPLRPRDVPPPAGLERTRVEVSAAPQPSARKEQALPPEAQRPPAEPLSPGSPPTRSEPAPPEHPLPAASQERVNAPRPVSQSHAPLVPSAPSELTRELVPLEAPPLDRTAPQRITSAMPPPSRGAAEEPRPIPAVNESLAAQAKTPNTADTGPPADTDGSSTESNQFPRTRPAGRQPTPPDSHSRLLANAEQRREPDRQTEPTKSVKPPTPQRPDLPRVYEQRVRADRQEIVRQQGGSPDTEAAVRAALDWLATHQEPDGHWDATKHGARRDRTTAGGDALGNMRPDTAVTGLALLAFLGAGHTHEGEQYADTVRRGLDYLISIQAKDGNLAGRATMLAAMYCHGMATLALAEAYGMTGDPKLEQPLRRAVAYTLAAQIRADGGWRYLPGDPHNYLANVGDTSQFGWQVMSLKAAETAGLNIPVPARHGMLRFLGYVTSGRQGGLAGYCYTRHFDGGSQPDRPTPTMTAEALFCRFLLGTTADNPLCGEAADYLTQHLPDERTDYYYWYYGTLALYQLQGPVWEKWNQAVQKRILNLQQRDGSWEPNDRWGGHGGRVFSTALAALTLEVYYRYKPAR